MQANLKGITHPCPYCEKDGRTPTVEQFMKHRQQHNPVSNSTQNCTCIESGYAQTTNHCPVHKNSTQNDHIVDVNKKIQNDWADLGEWEDWIKATKKYGGTIEEYLRLLEAKHKSELADARKEVEKEILEVIK